MDIITEEEEEVCMLCPSTLDNGMEILPIEANFYKRLTGLSPSPSLLTNRLEFIFQKLLVLSNSECLDILQEYDRFVAGQEECEFECFKICSACSSFVSNFENIFSEFMKYFSIIQSMRQEARQNLEASFAKKSTINLKANEAQSIDNVVDKLVNINTADVLPEAPETVAHIFKEGQCNENVWIERDDDAESIIEIGRIIKNPVVAYNAAISAYQNTSNDTAALQTLDTAGLTFNKKNKRKKSNNHINNNAASLPTDQSKNNNQNEVNTKFVTASIGDIETKQSLYQTPRVAPNAQDIKEKRITNNATGEVERVFSITIPTNNARNIPGKIENVLNTNIQELEEKPKFVSAASAEIADQCVSDCRSVSTLVMQSGNTSGGNSGRQEEYVLFSNERTAVTESARQIQSCSCKACDKSFTTNNLSKFLIIRSNDKPFECKICKVGFSSWYKYLSHLQTHNINNVNYENLLDSRPVASTKLSVSPQTSVTIKVEKNSIIPSKYAKYKYQRKTAQCNVCSMKLSSKEALKVHLRIHFNEKPFKCSICNKWFRTNCNMLRHRRESHPTLTSNTDFPSKLVVSELRDLSLQ